MMAKAELNSYLENQRASPFADHLLNVRDVFVATELLVLEEPLHTWLWIAIAHAFE